MNLLFHIIRDALAIVGLFAVLVLAAGIILEEASNDDDFDDYSSA